MNIAILRNYSLAYILAPNIVFALGWFRLQYAIPITICMAYLFFSQLRKADKNEAYQISSTNLLWLLLGAGFWTFCTGSGGLSFQIADYWIHNAKYYDLFKNPWPIYFPQIDQHACYYFGYFLLPAAISKLLGHLSITTLLIWTVLGYWLALQWLYLLLNKRKILIICFLFLGGVGHLIKVLFYKFNTSTSYHIATFYSEIWSLYDQSLWVTNQIIPILIISSIIVYDAFISDRAEDSLFPITLCFYWAIFPSIIFTVLFAIIFVKKYIANWRLLFTYKTLSPLILTGLAFLPTFIFLRASETLPVSGFIWQFEPLGEIMAEYFIGVVIDLLLLWLIIRELRGVDNLIPKWFIIATFMLFLLMSSYRIGHLNDWFVRGYNPMLFILALLIIRSLHRLYITKKWKKTVYFNTLIMILSLSVLIPIGHVVRSLQQNMLVSAVFPKQYAFSPIPYDIYPNTYEALLTKTSSGAPEANQYLGRKNSIYRIYLSRRHPDLIPISR